MGHTHEEIDQLVADNARVLATARNRSTVYASASGPGRRPTAYRSTAHKPQPLVAPAGWPAFTAMQLAAIKRDDPDRYWALRDAAVRAGRLPAGQRPRKPRSQSVRWR